MAEVDKFRERDGITRCKMRKQKSPTEFLDRFLSKHKKSCSYWIFSGDRHCSCGRDEAIKELDALKNRIMGLLEEAVDHDT